jgi:DNA-binding MarR family transcriptional regulator
MRLVGMAYAGRLIRRSLKKGWVERSRSPQTPLLHYEASIAAAHTI